MSDFADLFKAYLHLLLIVLAGFLATWLITILPSSTGVSPTVAVVATAAVSLLLAWVYEKVAHYGDVFRTFMYLGGQTAFLTCALILWETPWLPQSMLDFRPHLGSLWDIIGLNVFALGLVFCLPHQFPSVAMTWKDCLAIGVYEIGALCSVWLASKISANFGWHPVLCVVVPFVVSSFVLGTVYFALERGRSWIDWTETLTGVMLLETFVGTVVWFLILMNFSWLPEWFLDRRLYLMDHGGWFAAIGFVIGAGVCIAFIANLDSPSSSGSYGSSWGSGGGSSRSTAGSSLGTQFSQPTPSTSYDSPSMPAAPTWTYQAPPPPPPVDYGAAERARTEEQHRWEHHKRQNPQIFGPQ